MALVAQFSAELKRMPFLILAPSSQYNPPVLVMVHAPRPAALAQFAAWCEAWDRMPYGGDAKQFT